MDNVKQFISILSKVDYMFLQDYASDNSLTLKDTIQEAVDVLKESEPITYSDYKSSDYRNDDVFHYVSIYMHTDTLSYIKDTCIKYGISRPALLAYAIKVLRNSTIF